MSKPLREETWQTDRVTQSGVLVERNSSLPCERPRRCVTFAQECSPRSSSSSPGSVKANRRARLRTGHFGSYADLPSRPPLLPWGPRVYRRLAGEALGQHGARVPALALDARRGAELAIGCRQDVGLGGEVASSSSRYAVHTSGDTGGSRMTDEEGCPLKAWATLLQSYRSDSGNSGPVSDASTQSEGAAATGFSRSRRAVARPWKQLAEGGARPGSSWPQGRAARISQEELGLGSLRPSRNGTGRTCLLEPALVADRGGGLEPVPGTACAAAVDGLRAAAEGPEEALGSPTTWAREFGRAAVSWVQEVSAQLAEWASTPRDEGPEGKASPRESPKGVGGGVALAFFNTDARLEPGDLLHLMVARVEPDGLRLCGSQLAKIVTVDHSESRCKVKTEDGMTRFMQIEGDCLLAEEWASPQSPGRTSPRKTRAHAVVGTAARPRQNIASARI